MRHVKILGYQLPVPRHPILRIVLGILLVLFGFLGFLPILGFWMLPLGLIILSVDFPTVRRFRRRCTVKLGLYMAKQWPDVARKIGFTGLRATRAT
jgi:purine-cytosine permease-like protein